MTKTVPPEGPDGSPPSNPTEERLRDDEQGAGKRRRQNTPQRGSLVDSEEAVPHDEASAFQELRRPELRSQLGGDGTFRPRAAAS
jgi:hypothetical protein